MLWLVKIIVIPYFLTWCNNAASYITLCLSVEHLFSVLLLCFVTGFALPFRHTRTLTHYIRIHTHIYKPTYSHINVHIFEVNQLLVRFLYTNANVSVKQLREYFKVKRYITTTNNNMCTTLCMGGGSPIHQLWSIEHLSGHQTRPSLSAKRKRKTS